jgi:hypothetical protein
LICSKGSHTPHGVQHNANHSQIASQGTQGIASLVYIYITKHKQASALTMAASHGVFNFCPKSVPYTQALANCKKHVPAQASLPDSRFCRHGHGHLSLPLNPAQITGQGSEGCHIANRRCQPLNQHHFFPQHIKYTTLESSALDAPNCFSCSIHGKCTEHLATQQ